MSKLAPDYLSTVGGVVSSDLFLLNTVGGSFLERRFTT
jgi:hypothetical protein